MALGLDKVIPADIRDKIQQLLDRGRWPTFQQVDVLDKNHFPKNLENLDVAYCRLLLGNIYDPNDVARSQENVILAIRNIVECTRRDGLVCIVERDEPIFTPHLGVYLHSPNLKFLRRCLFQRGKMVQENFYVYYYRKL